MGDSPVRKVEAVIMWPNSFQQGSGRFIAVWFGGGFEPLESKLAELKHHINSKGNQRLVHGSLRVLRDNGGVMLALELSENASPDAKPIAQELMVAIKRYLDVPVMLQPSKVEHILQLALPK